MEDRLNRFRQRGRFRNSFRGRQSGQPDQPQGGQPTEAAAAMIDSTADDVFLDDTLASWEELKALEEEEKYTRFCLAKDRLDSENY